MIDTTTIENIQVLDKMKLAKEFIDNSKMNAAEAITSIKILMESNRYMVSNYDLRWLKDSPNISFDIINFDKIVSDFNNYQNRTKLQDNQLHNPLGLTDAEHWFNTLSDENKANVKFLSKIFNPPACG